MKTKAFFIEFSVIFMITFITASVVSWCWNFFAEGTGTCSWDTAFLFAIMFAVICPMIDLMKSESNQKQ
jgi:hypothetical protein